MNREVVRTPSVEALLLSRDSILDVSVEPPSGAHPLRAAIDARWQELLALNPRFHDGEMLAVSSWQGTSIRCRSASFRELAVRPRVQTGCELLAVTAVVAARGKDGGERLLLGKRHRQTRVYGGLWEFGPAGGLPPPPAHQTTLGMADFLRQVELELVEEAGLSLAHADVELVGLVRDLDAFSLDIAFKVCMRKPLEELQTTDRDWEYEEIRWATIPEASALVAADPASFIPPTRFMLENPAWLGPIGA